MKFSTRVVLSGGLSLIIGCIVGTLRYWQWFALMKGTLLGFTELNDSQVLLIQLLLPIVLVFLVVFMISGLHRNTFDSSVKNLIHFQKKLSKKIGRTDHTFNWEKWKNELAKQKKDLFSKIKNETKIRNSKQLKELQRLFTHKWSEALSIIIKRTARDAQILQEINRIELIILRSLSLEKNDKSRILRNIDYENESHGEIITNNNLTVEKKSENKAYLPDLKDLKGNRSILTKMQQKGLITNYQIDNFADSVIQFRQIVTENNGLYLLKNNQDSGLDNKRPSLLRLAKERLNNIDKNTEKFSAEALEEYIKDRNHFKFNTTNNNKTDKKNSSRHSPKITVTKTGILLDSLSTSHTEKIPDIIMSRALANIFDSGYWLGIAAFYENSLGYQFFQNIGFSNIDVNEAGFLKGSVFYETYIRKNDYLIINEPSLAYGKFLFKLSIKEIKNTQSIVLIPAKIAQKRFYLVLASLKMIPNGHQNILIDLLNFYAE